MLFSLGNSFKRVYMLCKEYTRNLIVSNNWCQIAYLKIRSMLHVLEQLNFIIPAFLSNQIIICVYLSVCVCIWIFFLSVCLHVFFSHFYCFWSKFAKKKDVCVLELIDTCQHFKNIFLWFYSSWKRSFT